jgi:hypothetical protein
MTDLNHQSSSDEKVPTVRLPRGKWTAPEIWTIGAFLFLAWIGWRYGWELSWILAAIMCLFALRHGVRWPLVKMIPISLFTFFSLAVLAFFIDWLVQPTDIYIKGGEFFAEFFMICMTLLLPPLAVLPFAQPLRKRLSSLVAALASSSFWLGLGTLLIRCLIGLLCLIVVIWLIKTIWYSV